MLSLNDTSIRNGSRTESGYDFFRMGARRQHTEDLRRAEMDWLARSAMQRRPAGPVRTVGLALERMLRCARRGRTGRGRVHMQAGPT